MEQPIDDTRTPARPEKIENGRKAAVVIHGVAVVGMNTAASLALRKGDPDPDLRRVTVHQGIRAISEKRISGIAIFLIVVAEVEAEMLTGDAIRAGLYPLVAQRLRLATDQIRHHPIMGSGALPADRLGTLLPVEERLESVLGHRGRAEISPPDTVANPFRVRVRVHVRVDTTPRPRNDQDDPDHEACQITVQTELDIPHPTH